MTDLIVVDKPKDFLMSTPKDMVNNAVEIANIFKNVVDSQGFKKKIGAKDYLLVEAWTTMGSLLGVLPRESRVIEHPDGSYEAYVDLVSVNTGRVVGGGSGYVGSDEQTWQSRPKFARRSMAITRATGKAFRLGFSWMANLAGYESTPAEEMEGVQQYAPAKPAKRAAAKHKSQLSIHDIQRLFGVAKEKGWTKEQLVEVSGKAFKVTSFDALKKVEYDALINTIQTKSFEKAVEELREYEGSPSILDDSSISF